MFWSCGCLLAYFAISLASLICCSEAIFFIYLRKFPFPIGSPSKSVRMQPQQLQAPGRPPQERFCLLSNVIGIFTSEVQPLAPRLLLARLGFSVQIFRRRETKWHPSEPPRETMFGVQAVIYLTK